MNNFDNSILVTGDIIADTDIYVGERMIASNIAAEGTIVRRVSGGAALLYGLISRLATVYAGCPRVIYGFNETELAKLPSHLSAHALYGRQKGGTAIAPAKDKVWRVTSALGYGAPPIDAAEPQLSPIAPSIPPRVLVLDDGGAGFRSLSASGRWPFAAVPDPTNPPGHWIVLKMSRPVAQGDLWRAVSGQFGETAGKRGFADRLVTIVNADFLRFHEAGISRGLSWEKTVREICQELASNAAVRPLLLSRHLVIVFRHEGVLWLDTSKQPSERARLIFDSSFCEGEWESTLADPSGDVFGNLTVLTAFIAAELGLRPDLAADTFEDALKTGLEAARTLRLVGHEPDPLSSTPREPGFPFQKLQEVAAARAAGKLETKLVATTVPCSNTDCVPSDSWTIIAHHERRIGVVHPLFGTAIQVALKGPLALKDVPHAKFGKLTSVDRDEIEALRGLRRTMLRYVLDSKERKPLAVAVFGPPGSGKSFGVEEIADEIFAGKPCLLKFNLSQFAGSSELIGAFHQVRDKVMEGFVPVVFWDEFDAREYSWLQYFLAPLEDGRFQAGQITHALSRSIFVFAGGTSCDFEHFGPAPQPRTSQKTEPRLANDAERREDESRRRDFILKKGPDFVSRLDAHFDVLGSNQRQLFNFKTRKWDRDDAADVGFPIRRALLIRSVLRLDEEAQLQAEPALVSALLRVSRYQHSTRSLKKIVLLLNSAPGEPLRRANLPAPSVLARHLEDPDELDRIFAETRDYRGDESLFRVAAAVNESYQRFVAGNPPDVDYLKSFALLDSWGKATNVAAATRLPEILALAGLRLIKGETASAEEEAEVAQQLEHHMLVLAEREHELWMEFHFQNSWAYSETRDKARRRHPLLLPFNRLSAAEREKDHQAIRSYPELARLAGYKIGFLGAKPTTTNPPKIEQHSPQIRTE